MPANALGRLVPRRRTGGCWVRPDRRDWLGSLGLRTAGDFLSLPGTVVSGHVGRNVSRVHLGGTTAYLKREHRIRLRDRFRSWADGFGWLSLSAREAGVLGHLERHGLPAPRPLAVGEYGGEGFLLLEATEASTDLRALTPVDPILAEWLGRTVARIHLAGVDQPDLFAKHVLVGRRTLTVTILDWQRAVLRRRVGWAGRLRGLAALCATFPSGSAAAWAALLAGYEHESARDAGPGPRRLADRVEAIAAGLRQRRGIDSQRLRTCAPVNQELVRIGGERVCVIPEVAPALQSDADIAAVYDLAAGGRTLLLPGGRRGFRRVGCYRLPFARWWAALRGRSWRSPEVRTARLLFHLERHGIAAPKLLAYGQMVPAVAAARAFLMFEPIPVDLLGPGHSAAARAILDRLHDAGCRLTEVGPRGEPFGLHDGAIVIGNVYRIRLARRLTARRVRRDRERLEAYFRGLP